MTSFVIKKFVNRYDKNACSDIEHVGTGKTFAGTYAYNILHTTYTINQPAQNNSSDRILLVLVYW